MMTATAQTVAKFWIVVLSSVDALFTYDHPSHEHPHNLGFTQGYFIQHGLAPHARADRARRNRGDRGIDCRHSTVQRGSGDGWVAPCSCNLEAADCRS